MIESKNQLQNDVRKWRAGRNGSDNNFVHYQVIGANKIYAAPATAKSFQENKNRIRQLVKA